MARLRDGAAEYAAAGDRRRALNDFFARLVVTEQGRLNLSSAPRRRRRPAHLRFGTSACTAASAASAGGREPPIAIAVGGVKLNNGRVDFSDHRAP